MFLEDELEYVRLKRSDNIMGWLAIMFVAALVFMFAGVMNSASATGSPSAHRTEAAIAAPSQPTPAATQAGIIGHDTIVAAVHVTLPAPASRDVASIQSGDVQTLALSTPDDNAGLAHTSTAKLADHDIKTGALILSFALMGGSFVMLTFGGPRGGSGSDKREDEDMIDAL
jgi:hypothetical protein